MWATTSTVGYGDFAPTTYAGRVVSVLTGGGPYSPAREGDSTSVAHACRIRLVRDAWTRRVRRVPPAAPRACSLLPPPPLHAAFFGVFFVALVTAEFSNKLAWSSDETSAMMVRRPPPV